MDHPEEDLGTDWASSCDGMRRAAQEQGPCGSCWGNPGEREKYKPQGPAWPQTRAEMHRKEVVFLRAMQTELMPTNGHMPQWKG